jgi:hypothetical protein
MGKNLLIVAGSIDSLRAVRLRGGGDLRARVNGGDRPPVMPAPHAAAAADRGRVAPCRSVPMAYVRPGDPRHAVRAAGCCAEATGGRAHGGARAGAAGFFAWQPFGTGSGSAGRHAAAGTACLSGA